MNKYTCCWCNKTYDSKEWDESTKQTLNNNNIPSSEDKKNIYGRVWHCPSCKEKNDSCGML